MNRTVRTFVAVEISPEIRARAAQLISRLNPTAAKVRWVEPHNMHLTLKFLGDVDLLELPELCQAVSDAVADLPPFEIEARGAGVFPDLRNPRTVWLGIGRGADEMIELHAAVERALTGLGFRREQRRFRPHLTLGRVRGAGPGNQELAERVAEHADFAGGVASVEAIVVFSSELGRDGPTHEALATAALNGR
ncbi:MAG TPA: RNA 2',3'-cyclic phosphodiesterase [Pirellulales bacterium]|nr:RNA 2',3'-cyclic phosphodiesterase [Pirellulales bacterium]